MSIFFLSGVVLLAISFILYTCAFGGIIYQHVIELPKWKTTTVQVPNFGKFFKLLMPASVISLLIATALLFATAGKAQLSLLVSIAGVILTTVFTNRYFVPIHRELFHTQITSSNRETAARRWQMANAYRMVLMLITTICILMAYTLLLIS